MSDNQMVLYRFLVSTLMHPLYAFVARLGL
jgi:hypothetical protein